MKKYLVTLALSALAIVGFSQETIYETEQNTPYYPESIRQSDDYISGDAFWIFTIPPTERILPPSCGFTVGTHGWFKELPMD